jgi:hypothetical protein
MKLVWTPFGVLCPAWRMPRVSSFVCSIPPIALACCLAVPPSVAGQPPPGTRELGPLGKHARGELQLTFTRRSVVCAAFSACTQRGLWWRSLTNQ